MIELASEQQDTSSKVVVIQLWAADSAAAQNG
jgi:hypothetical protein